MILVRPMSVFFSAFTSPSRGSDAWFSVGLDTSFPNINSSDVRLLDRFPCSPSSTARVPGCKVYQVPRDDASKAIEVPVDDVDAEALQDQVLVFQWKGRWCAVDNVSEKKAIVSTFLNQSKVLSYSLRTCPIMCAIH